MLVLTRKPGELIDIGDSIVITVVEIQHHSNQVRIGIDAPKHVVVNRREITDAIAEQKQREQQ
jgi:carbon storage regulator